MAAHDPTSSRTAPLARPTGLRSNTVKDIFGALNILLAELFVLHLKTNNFHWHVAGPHFRDYYLVKQSMRRRRKCHQPRQPAQRSSY
jgi:hypothetical protein